VAITDGLRSDVGDVSREDSEDEDKILLKTLL
jgi:hypothetical protein